MVIDNQLYFFDLFEIIYFIVGEVILNMEQTIDTLIEPHDASPTEIVIFKIISGSGCFLVQSMDRERRLEAPLTLGSRTLNQRIVLDWTGNEIVGQNTRFQKMKW